jgi:hypothetical protein
MDRRRRSRPPRLGRNAGPMLVALGLAALVAFLVALLPDLTGDAFVDGGLGVVFGLYVCAHPAANAIDLLFHPDELLGSFSWSGLGWFGLNLLALGVGFFFLFAGASQLVG